MTEARLLGNRYRVGELLGRGGMATVRKAVDTRLAREVAVKELRVDLASDNTFQERFRREAQAAAGLNHPNIVSVFDTGEHADPVTGVSVPYIVMELVHGRTLRDVLRDGRPIVPRKAIEFTVGVLDALSYSHANGIVHRDIKPANVMITEHGHVKVMDFGIARAVADTSSTMTQTAAVIGTAQYLSPEQARGETVDARSDLYSAGCLLYELLVGRPPFTGDSPVSVAYQHVREAPLPPSQLDTEISLAMDAVVLTSLAKAPGDRYQSAAEFAADLRRLLTGQPVQASPVYALGDTAPTNVLPAVADRPLGSAPGTGQFAFDQTAPTSVVVPGPPPRRGHRLLWWLITGALVTALLAGTALLLWGNRTPTVTVPAVQGFTQSAAESTLKAARLVPHVSTTQGADDDTVGHVVGQSPGGGSSAKAESVVEVTVNVGPRKTPVPLGIKGKDVNAVRTELGKLGFTAVDAVPATTEPATAKTDEVLAVDPAEGTNVPVGQKITLTYATGKAEVPNLRGLSREQAEHAAHDAGFTNLKWEAQPSAVQSGSVVDTAPTAFNVANKADPLTIYVASPLPTPTVTTTSLAPGPPPVVVTSTQTTTQSTKPAPPSSTSTSTSTSTQKPTSEKPTTEPSKPPAKPTSSPEPTTKPKQSPSKGSGTP